MKNKIFEHFYGIFFVSALLIAALVMFNNNRKNDTGTRQEKLRPFLDLPIANIHDPFQRALTEDIMNIFYPDKKQYNDSLLAELFHLKEVQYSSKLQRSHVTQSLTFEKFLEITGMYLKFLFIYAMVMILTFYGVQTLALWRFVKRRNIIATRISTENKSTSLSTQLLQILKKVAKVIAYFVLFSPAYVIAYSIRTEFNTDSTLFMILLGVISNGLLVTYANKFYAFLNAEYHRGYVETAIVKNLNNDYSFNGNSGIKMKSLLNPVKRFENHVLDHIYRNANLQYLSTIKEQASFLITGLIIIEMALNIHGHLTYEMLRQILYKNYDIVIIIILGIFYAVKITDIITDILIHRENLKYEN